MKVSTTRPVAADLVPTDMMSIALMGTSRTSSCRCSAYPDGESQRDLRSPDSTR